MNISSMTGRRRLLSDKAMLDICDAYASGDRVQMLARRYGVSTHTIYSIVYWTPKNAVQKSETTTRTKANK
jgi:transposase-like protein